MTSNAAKVFVLSFTVFFIIDQYIVRQESLYASLSLSALSGVIAALIFILLKKRADRKRNEALADDDQSATGNDLQ